MIGDLGLRELLSLLPVMLGTAFAFIAGVGILRMPDLFLRMSMSTKAATLGVGSMLVGAIIYFDEVGISARGFAIIIFLLLTAPVSAQMIGRAGYIDNETKIWEKTTPDELAGKYDLVNNTLASREEDRLSQI